MGIHGSATCVMHFEEAEGYLVGAPHKGLRCMFTMMNGARLGVGLQGLGLGETAYQSAAAYAKDRRQGRGLKGAEEPEASADPIIVHPDVRRMLLTQRAINEGSRALAYWAALQLDISRSHEDASVREDADELVQLMTPIIKAFFTDYGFEATNLAVQVHGGHGYIREHGMEQLVRDARISQIYEGANGIQALDLVGRKLPQRAGRYLRHFFHPAVAFIEANKDDPELADIVVPVGKALGKLQTATLVIAQRGLGDPEEAGAAARTISGCSGWWRWATCGARWRSSPATSRTAKPSTTPSSRPPLLRAEDPAGHRRALPQDHGRQGHRHGPRRRRVLSGGCRAAHDRDPLPRPARGPGRGRRHAGAAAGLSFVPMAAVRALVRRGVRDLHLVTVPQAGIAADLLIGAGCVATIETAAVSLGELGNAPRFTAAVEGGRLAIRDSTCPAIHAALQAAEKGVPFMPLRGLIGSDLLGARPDWHVIDNPLADSGGDPSSCCRRSGPDVALFHAPYADEHGNVWLGAAPRARDHGPCGQGDPRHRRGSAARRPAGRRGAGGGHPAGALRHGARRSPARPGPWASRPLRADRATSPTMPGLRRARRASRLIARTM